ncbi:MAG TPA: STAS domain-containing protein [Acidimicrobiales bacterium]|nr:STAS domain-containing protein [Acidimicrobiales bacterium]
MQAGNPWAAGQLRTDVVVVDGSVCVRLQGELDLATAPDLWRACEVLDGQLEPGLSVFVDLAGLQFLDAAGLGTLVRLRNRVHDAGAHLSVLDPSPPIRRVFEHARLESLVDSAAAAGGGSAAPC